MCFLQNYQRAKFQCSAPQISQDSAIYMLDTRRIFAFTRALCLGETLVLLDVVSQGFFGNDGLSFLTVSVSVC